MQEEKQNPELDQLREFKKRSGWSYPKISELMGVHEQTIVYWLTGKFKPSSMAKEKIRVFLKTYFFK